MEIGVGARGSLEPERPRPELVKYAKKIRTASDFPIGISSPEPGMHGSGLEVLGLGRLQVLQREFDARP